MTVSEIIKGGVLPEVFVEHPSENCGPENSGYCIDFGDECMTGYEGIGPEGCSSGRSAECCVPIE